MPNYLATTWNRLTATDFMLRAFQGGKPAVLWIIQIDKRADPKGANNKAYQISVNKITKRSPGVPDEEEFLFEAYSAFKVVKVEVSPNPKPHNPHKIFLDVVCPKECKPDLPL